MKRLIILILLLVLTGISIEAQVVPLAGHLDSCNANPVMFEYFGPHCLNPVTWDDASIIPWQSINIGDTVGFVRENGFTDFGRVTGYYWDFVTSRYKYYVMTAPPYTGIFAEFVAVAPERIIP